MNIKKIKPLFTAVVVTANVYSRDYKEHNIISPKANKLKEYQKVVAVGDSCRGIEEGDLVCIDLSSYAQWKYKKNSVKSDMEELHNEIVGYNVPQIKIDGQDCMFDYKIDYINSKIKGDHSQWLAFSESVTDLPMLELVGHPVVISRGKSQKWAEKEGFEQIIWNK